jgi:glyoxylate carboligase
MTKRNFCADAKLTRQTILKEIENRRINPKPIVLKVPRIRTALERKTDDDDIPIKPQRVFRYLGLIHQAEKYLFDMEYEVQIWYDSLRLADKMAGTRMKAAGAGDVRADSGPAEAQSENEGRGFDFVKFAQVRGTMGERIFDPKDLPEAFKRGSV